MSQNPFPAHLCGWVDHPTRLAVAASLPWGTLSQAAPNLMAGPVQDVFLYKAWKDVLGKYPDYPAQQIGDCTSFGSGHATDLLQCIEVALSHKPYDYKELCTEAIYGIGREIAGMLGGGDGCYGAAVAKALTQYGAIPRDQVGPYSGQRAQEWGATGVPQSVKDLCAAHKLGAAAMVTTCDELDAGLANGYPGIVCSNQGFTMHRDANGCCQPEGSWGHCMGISARRIQGGERQYLIDQSWGDNVPDGPQTDDQPSFSFWIDENVMGSMLALQDSFVLSSFNGFPARVVPAHWTWASFA